MPRTLPIIAILTCGLSASAARAQAATQATDDDPAMEARALVAYRLDANDVVRLDGLLSEEFWDRADAATEFLQQEPDEGAAPTERTEVRVAYDDENLYIGAVLHDSDPSGVLGRELRRDAGLGADDRFMWILDTFGDGRTGYFFETNPAGLMGDGLLRGSGSGRRINKSWDGIWEAAVERGDWGWSVEIRIPFGTLNFDPADAAWGINFQRTVRRKNEELLWSGHRRNQGLFRPLHAGRLTGLEGLSQGLGLEAKPYGVASWQRAPAHGAPEGDVVSDAGFDLTYSITPSLRASVTVNTDFAETEVDQRRVNLTRFPLFFPEQRDFFLEGSGVFGFARSSGPRPYFSRRIGLVGGRQVPITWGARLGGQAGLYELGFLQIRTGEHELGPAEDFTVARAKRAIGRSSTIGGIFTRRATHAAEDSPALAGHTLGADLDLFTSTFRGDQNLQFEAFVVWHNDPAADARAGGGEGDEGESGAAGAATTFGDRSARGIRLNYPNDFIRAHVSFREFGDHYSPAVGFVRRRGFRRTQPSFALRPRPGWDAVRQLEFGTRVEHLTDLAGELETFNASLTLLGLELESGDRAEFEVGTETERIERDFEIHPGVVIAAGEHTFRGWSAELSTASRRMVSGRLNVSGGEFWSGDRLRHQARVGLSPRPGLGITLEWERNHVELPTGEFETNLVRTRGGWQASPWVSLTGSVQYDDVSRVVGVFGRFNWTVRPGSDLYLVYTHNLLNPPLAGDPRGGLETLDRRASTKLTYTYRF